MINKVSNYDYFNTSNTIESFLANIKCVNNLTNKKNEIKAYNYLQIEN